MKKNQSKSVYHVRTNLFLTVKIINKNKNHKKSSVWANSGSNLTSPSQSSSLMSGQGGMSRLIFCLKKKKKGDISVPEWKKGSDQNGRTVVHVEHGLGGSHKPNVHIRRLGPVLLVKILDRRKEKLLRCMESILLSVTNITETFTTNYV